MNQNNETELLYHKYLTRLQNLYDQHREMSQSRIERISVQNSSNGLANKMTQTETPEERKEMPMESTKHKGLILKILNESQDDFERVFGKPADIQRRMEQIKRDEAGATKSTYDTRIEPPSEQFPYLGSKKKLGPTVAPNIPGSNPEPTTKENGERFNHYHVVAINNADIHAPGAQWLKMSASPLKNSWDAEHAMVKFLNSHKDGQSKYGTTNHATYAIMHYSGPKQHEPNDMTSYSAMSMTHNQQGYSSPYSGYGRHLEQNEGYTHHVYPQVFADTAATQTIGAGIYQHDYQVGLKTSPYGSSLQHPDQVHSHINNVDF